MIEKFTVSRDDYIYQAWPDVALTASGKLVCVFAECTHHADRGYTRFVYVTSTDRGRTWSAKKPLTEALRGQHRKDPWWDNPRICTLSDGRLCALADRHDGPSEYGTKVTVFMLFSDDEGETWCRPIRTPAAGGGLDRLIELKCGRYAGRWVLSFHQEKSDGWTVRCCISDDQGKTWSGPNTIAANPELLLCEPSVLELPGGELVCFMREESKRGLDAFKCISRDGGASWAGPIPFALPGCHRPVAGVLQSGLVMITHRFAHCGKGWLGWWTQNTFAALTNVESCLATSRAESQTRILPLDFDRSGVSDCGYTGWVQFDDGEIYVVNYIVDDAPKAHIRGYSLRQSDFLIEP